MKKSRNQVNSFITLYFTSNIKNKNQHMNTLPTYNYPIYPNCF